jgi:hypothetical protein
MSVPVAVPAITGPGPRERALARGAAAAARVLILLPPARLCRVLRAVSSGARPAAAAEAASARAAVVSVSARCAGLGCTQRSVATALLCRVRGSWPDWCTGFRVRPFGAHAWVEADGLPVGEDTAITAFRTVLAVRAPRSRAMARPGRGSRP